MKSFFKKHNLKKLGGLNNSNYLLSYYGNDYVLRIPSKDNENNFNNENKILTLVSTKGISPKILYQNKTTGILLSKYIPNSSLNFKLFTSRNFIKNLIPALKNLHTYKSDNFFNPFSEIHKNLSFLRDINFNFNHNMQPFIDKLTYLESSLSNSITLGLCHNDLNYSNILYKNEKVYFIDFEFAGMGDIFFDLATLSWFLDDCKRNLLLESYFGYVSSDLKAKLLDYLFIVKLWNATWSFKKSLTGTSTYDYKLGGNLVLDSLIDEYLEKKLP